MKYAILIYRDEAKFAALSEAEVQEMRGAYVSYVQALRDVGAYVAGEPLEPTSTGATVQIRDGKQTVQDGPYAELKEQLAGFILIDVADFDKAVEWSARCPGASFGTLEVRPVMPMDH